MSKIGDFNALVRRRTLITREAKPCPVCGRPVVARSTPNPGVPGNRLIKALACSTTCIVEQARRNRIAKETANV